MRHKVITTPSGIRQLALRGTRIRISEFGFSEASKASLSSKDQCSKKKKKSPASLKAIALRQITGFGQIFRTISASYQS